MRSLLASTLFAALAAAQAPLLMSTGPAPTAGAWAPAAGAGQTHMVMVGGPNLEFTPNMVMAQPGDTIRFMFLQKNHSVEQSLFASPCSKMAGGQSSGFKPNPNGDMATAPNFDVPVTDTKALWFYCGQTGHCAKGMVFAVNPTAEKSLAAYRNLALATNGSAANAAAAAPAGAATLAAIQQNPPAQIASTLTFGADGAVATGGVLNNVAGGNVAVGSGTNGAGQSCQCSCLCGAGAFTNPADGIGMFGGVGGEMPSLAAMPAAGSVGAEAAAAPPVEAPPAEPLPPVEGAPGAEANPAIATGG